VILSFWSEFGIEFGLIQGNIEELIP